MLLCQQGEHMKGIISNVLKKIVDEYYSIKDRYAAIKDTKQVIKKDLRGLFEYAFNTFDKITCQSNGLFGIYSDLNNGGQNISQKINNIKDDFTNLENIIFKRDVVSHEDASGISGLPKETSIEERINTNEERINKNEERTNTSEERINKNVPHIENPVKGENPAKGIRPASRIKSALISSVAGVGAAAWLYKDLRKQKGNNLREQKSNVEQKAVQKNNDMARGASARNVSFGGDAYGGAYIYKNFSRQEINDVITLKNRYSCQKMDKLQERIKQEKNIVVGNLETLLKDVMTLKATVPEYSSLKTIYYDKRIAPDGMKDEIISIYTSSDMSLREASMYLEKKYGMHVSYSTISKHARNYLNGHGKNFKNRREVKEYYKKHQKRREISSKHLSS